MSRLARHLVWLLLAATPLAVVAGRLAWAQQPAAREAVEADGTEDEAAAREKLRLAQQQAVMEAQRAAYDQYLDRLVFGTNGPVKEAALRAEYEAGFAREIDRLGRICGLTEIQQKNLHAAGRGDIKRFFDRAAEARGRLRMLENPRMFLPEARRDAQSLSQERTALAAAESPIFTKAIRHLLTAEQVARLKKDDDDRKIFRHRAAVRWTVVMLTRSLGLSDDQRRRFEALLLAETRPPGKFGTFDYPIVMNQAARIPAARIRPIFDELQWRLIQNEFAVARAQGKWLHAGGFEPLEMIGD